MTFLACKVLKICRSAFFGTRGIVHNTAKLHLYALKVLFPEH